MTLTNTPRKIGLTVQTPETLSRSGPLVRRSSCHRLVTDPLWIFDRFERSTCISLPFESFAYSLHLPVDILVSPCRRFRQLPSPRQLPARAR